MPQMFTHYDGAERIRSTVPFRDNHGLYPQQNPVDSIAILRRLNSPENADTLTPVFQSMYEDANTADPRRRAMALDRVDEFGRSLGAGPEFEAQQRAEEQDRLSAIDQANAEEANLSSGQPGRIAMLKAALQNRLADVNSEAAAGRQFAPNASALYARNTGTENALAQVRYGYPAQIDAQTKLAVADREARGKVEAEQARNATLPDEAFYAILKQIVSDRVKQGGGGLPDANAVAALRKLLQPGQTVTLPVPVPSNYPRGSNPY